MIKAGGLKSAVLNLSPSLVPARLNQLFLFCRRRDGSSSSSRHGRGCEFLPSFLCTLEPFVANLRAGRAAFPGFSGLT